MCGGVEDVGRRRDVAAWLLNSEILQSRWMQASVRRGCLQMWKSGDFCTVSEQAAAGNVKQLLMKIIVVRLSNLYHNQIDGWKRAGSPSRGPFHLTLEVIRNGWGRGQSRSSTMYGVGALLWRCSRVQSTKVISSGLLLGLACLLCLLTLVSGHWGGDHWSTKLQV